MTKYHRTSLCIAYCLLLLVLSGCATIPKESVILSEELTNMIHSARVSHLAMVDEYIAERRRRIDIFMEQKWIPDFMTFFVSSSTLLKDMEKASNASEKEQVMLDFTKAASKEISKRRTTLMDALDEIERALKNAIEDHYADMLMVNQALTAHLHSAAKVTATREELLKQLKIKPKEILSLDKIDKVIEKIISYKGQAEEISGMVDEVKTLIKGGK